MRATEWHIALMGPDASDAQRLACARWRAEHPDHERAWRQLQGFGQRLAALPRAAAAAALSIPISTPSSPPSSPRQRPGRRRALALLGTAVVAAGGWQWTAGGGDEEARGIYRAAAGKRRRLTLPDGSTLEMNADTEVAVRFGAAERRLVLLSGEIAVATAPDAAMPPGHDRPFRVQTAHGLLRALGTEFTVRQEADRSWLGVQQGAVEIRPGNPDGIVPGDAPFPTARIVQAGQRAVFDRDAVQTIEPSDPADTAWRHGMLVAADMRLDEFLQRLGRHRPGHLHCAAEVAALRISGVYPLDDTDRVLDALPHVLPVEVWRLTRYLAGVRARTG
jgi:transmembrane sensor